MQASEVLALREATTMTLVSLEEGCSELSFHMGIILTSTVMAVLEAPKPEAQVNGVEVLIDRHKMYCLRSLCV